MSDEQLQRDIERIEPLIPFDPETSAAWQRLRARLTPDRERVAWGMFLLLSGADDNDLGRKFYQDSRETWLDRADAAIAAMLEGK